MSLTNALHRIRGSLKYRDNKSDIFSGVVLVSLFVLLGKLAGFTKESAIAWRYGIHPIVDAYAYLINLLTNPISIWFSLATILVVPLLAQAKPIQAAADSHLTHLFKQELLGLSMMLGTGLVILAFLGGSWFLETGRGGISGKSLEAAQSMIQGLSLLLPLGMLISMFSAWLLAEADHRSTLLECIPAFFILAFILIPTETLAQPLVWGTVVGFVFHLGGLVWVTRSKGNFPHPILGFRAPQWRTLAHSFGIVVTGQILMGLTGILDQYYAAQIGQGANATLNYANRVLSLILSFCVLTVSRASLPIFAKMDPGAPSAITSMTHRWSGYALASGICLTTLCWTGAELMVSLIFQRGAFRSESIAPVADALRIGLIQIPFYLAGIVVFYSNAARGKHFLNGMATTGGALAKVCVLSLSPSAWGLTRIQLSSVAMYIVFFAILIYGMKRSNHGAK